MITTCPTCEAEIEVDMDHAVLRVDVVPTPCAELVFCCPKCQAPAAKDIGGNLLALLMLVGVRPLRLGEPTLDPSDVPVDAPPFTREDLLTWHEQLARIANVVPWQ